MHRSRWMTGETLTMLGMAALLLAGCSGSSGGGGRGKASTVGLAATTFSVGEGDGLATITLERTGASKGAVTVDYATADVSATAGADYNAAAGSVSWADGETGTKSVPVTILDDGLVEGPETLDFALSNLSANVLPGTLTAVLTIIDDDVPPAGTLQLVATAFSVGEAGGTLAVDVTRTGGSAGAVSVDYGTADGTAMQPADYASASGTLNWADGDMAPRTISVTIVDDGAVENDETFTITLTNPLGGAALGTQVVGTATIIDDDMAGGTSGDLAPGFGNGGVVTADTGGPKDFATGVAMDASSLYIVGYDEAPAAQMQQWRIEKRNLATGALDPAFGTGGVQNSDPSADDDDVDDVAIDGVWMYIVGRDRAPGATDPQWRIEKRSLADGAYDAAFGSGGFEQSNPIVNPTGGFLEGPSQIALDGTDMYISGSDEMPGTFDFQWRCEKRNLVDGALDGTFASGRGVYVSNPMPGGIDTCQAVVLDATHVYLLGGDLTQGAGDDRIRIEKIDKSGAVLDPTFGGGGVESSNPTGGVDVGSAMASDGTWLYTASIDSGGPTGDSRWHLEKRSLSTGALDPGFGTAGIDVVNPSADADEPEAIVVDGSFIYVVGWESVVTIADQAWRIEKRNASNGAYEASFGSAGVVTENPSAGGDVCQDIVVDGTYIYLVGWDEAIGAGDWQWRIERRFK